MGGDLLGSRLLAKLYQDVFDILHGFAGNPVRKVLPLPRVHAKIQGGMRMKTHSAARIINLERGDSEVGQDIAEELAAPRRTLSKSLLFKCEARLQAPTLCG